MVNDYQENYVTGWVKMYRSFINWEWFTVPNMVHIFTYCLLKANHKDNRWRGVEVKRGSFITSLDTIKNDTGLSIQQIRTCLKRLEKSNEINKQSNKQHTVITVCKYDTYQSFNDETNTQDNKQPTDEQQTGNKQLTTNNNDNNIKNEDTYKEQDFLKNWNEARKWKTKQPSNLNVLKTNEKDLFWNASQLYTKEQFKEAIMGLFTQERIPVEIMWFRPKHFLENIDTYLDAKQHNNITLYKNV